MWFLKGIQTSKIFINFNLVNKKERFTLVFTKQLITGRAPVKILLRLDYIKLEGDEAAHF